MNVEDSECCSRSWILFLMDGAFVMPYSFAATFWGDAMSRRAVFMFHASLSSIKMSSSFCPCFKDAAHEAAASEIDDGDVSTEDRLG